MSVAEKKKAKKGKAPEQNDKYTVRMKKNKSYPTLYSEALSCSYDTRTISPTPPAIEISTPGKSSWDSTSTPSPRP